MCKIPIAVQEEAFLICIIDNIDRSHQLYLHDSYYITNAGINESLIAQLVKATRTISNDCIRGNTVIVIPKYKLQNFILK